VTTSTDGRTTIGFVIPVIGLAFVVSLRTRSSSGRPPCFAIIETPSQGALDWGDRTRGFEGLYSLTDEFTMPTRADYPGQ